MSKRNVSKSEMKLFEKVDIKKLKLLISCKNMNEQIKDQLKSYKKRFVDGYVPVNYSFSKTSFNKGRLYAQNSLSYQSFKRQIRSYLVKDLYYDIDMVNAQPRILVQYCKKHDIECEKLQEYVDNRDHLLKKIMKFHNCTRNDAKELILRLCHLGNYVVGEDLITPGNKMKFVSEFKSELVRIVDEICEIEEELYKQVDKNKETDNKGGSLIAMLCFTLENKCLMAMYDYFTKQNIKVGTLCFDGLLIEQNNNLGNVLHKKLRECEKYVFAKTKYHIKLEDKIMDEELTFEIPKYDDYVDSDSGAQQKLFQIEGADKFKYCNKQLYIFNEKTGMFEKDIETLYYYLMKNSQYLNIDLDKKTENYGKSSAYMAKVVPFVKTVAKDNNWITKTENSSLGYLLFKDGIYNMKTGKFKKGFDPKIVFHKNIPHIYPERDPKLVKKAMKISFGKLFEDPSTIIAALSRALAGDTNIKKFYFCPGKTNAGKSVLIGMLKTAFGGYVGNFNAESLAFSSNMDSKDEAAKNRWGLLVRFCRMVFSNEINMNKKLSGNNIKKHSSGKDLISARTHNKEEEDYKPHYTIFCMLNDIPVIEPMDEAITKRLEYLEFPYQFVGKDEVAIKDHFREKDDDLDDKIENQDFINGFIHILLDGYKDYLENGMPEFDQEIKDNWTLENKQGTEVIDTITDYFEITKNKKDTIPIRELRKFKDSHKDIFSSISLKRFKEILINDLGLVEDRDSTVRVWKGIKKIEKPVFEI